MNVDIMPCWQFWKYVQLYVWNNVFHMGMWEQENTIEYNEIILYVGVN